MGKAKRIKREVSWKWIYFASFFALVLVLKQTLDWGTSGDDSYYFYKAGFRTWSDILGHLFFPPEAKVFIFGEDRPLQYFIFKSLWALDVGVTGYRAYSWVVNWLACLAFSWGIISVFRLVYPIASTAIWFAATLMWWCPPVVMSTSGNLIDVVMLGLVGAHFGLLLADPKTLPKAIRRATIRLGLSIFSAFLGCQAFESAWIVLVWGSGFLLLHFLTKGTLKKNLRRALLSAAIVAFHILVFRSLNPADANRQEVARTYDLSSFLRMGKFYGMIAFNAVAEPMWSSLGFHPTAVGIDALSHPYAFLLTFSALILLFVIRKPSTGKEDKRASRFSWLVLLGGVGAVIPYLIISNRQMLYYSNGLLAFVTLFVAIRAYLFRPGPGKTLPWRFFGLDPVLLAYFLGTAIAGAHVITGWNYMHFYAGQYNGNGTRNLYDRVMALPGASECSGTNPCCLQMLPKTDWGFDESIPNWYLGLPKHPPFISPGMPCSKTLSIQQ